MKKPAVFLIKLVVMAAVIALLGWELYKAWNKVGMGGVVVDWRWGALAVAGFCGSMLTSALMWRWIAGRMGERGDEKKRLPTLPLLGAYTFSQMGKYVPGKVVLLLMRIERAGRVGMPASVCTLSTLLENALYMISGGLIGMTAVFPVLSELRAQNKISEAQQQWQWPVLILAVAALVMMCYPPVFYGLVNRVSVRMKKSGVPEKERLGMGTLGLAVVGFVPCWIFGGIALWASLQCVAHGAGTGAAGAVGGSDFGACKWFAGAYALSVILGMVSLLPAGLGVREAVLGVAVTLQMSEWVGHDQAVILGTVAAGLQRLFQVVAEVLLGVLGGAATGISKAKTTV